MSLARAFTQRIRRGVEPTSPTSMRRGHTVKINPNTISSPITLLSTTNVHALTAPDIRKASSESASSASSTHSGEDSIFSAIDRSFLHNAGTNTGDTTPVTPATPQLEPTKDSFFENKTLPYVPAAPSLPQRSPSHSRDAHVELSRKRSIQRMSPPPSTAHTLQRQASVRETIDLFSTNVHDNLTSSLTPTDTLSPHPFGEELAKVNEVAEEFGAVVNKPHVNTLPVIYDEEELYMQSRGLYKFGVEDYINEIGGLYSGGVYEGKLGAVANPWI